MKRRHHNKNNRRSNKKVLKTNVNNDSSQNQNQNQNQKRDKRSQHSKSSGEGVKCVSTNVVKERDDKRQKKEQKQGFHPFSHQNKGQSRNNRRREIFKKERPQNKRRQDFRVVKRDIIPYEVKTLENVQCSICEKRIVEMSSAIKVSEDKYSHFDCIMKDIKNKHTLTPAQRVVYLGSNTFGIIEDVRENGKTKFKINDRIEFSEKKSL